MLSREDFSRERIDLLREHAAKLDQTWVITHEERDASRHEATKHLRKGQAVWVFGYGSLMWNPAFHVAQTARARIYGYHRAFCLSLTFGRGSPEKPGLMLGLESGGSCVGMAHKIAPKNVSSELEILWMREMLGGTYIPKWLNAELPNGKKQRVLTFIANKSHLRYIGTQPFKKSAKRIATSEGYLGDNRTYLYNTIEGMDELGIGDGSLHRLEHEVRRIAKEPRSN